MIMALPKHFNHPTVKLCDNTLFIKNLIRFEDLMYELSYALRKRTCCYCGKKLSVRNSTLDHRWPRYSGGVSITNNLYTCCSDCNSAKSKLTHDEFLVLQKLSPTCEKKKFLKLLEFINDISFRVVGFKLPNEWISNIATKSINVTKYNSISSMNFRGKRYERISLFYEKYNNFPIPVVVDKNNKLLDGYNTYLYAIDNSIEYIPAIQLENVILVND